MYEYYNDVCNKMLKLNKKKICKLKLYVCYIVFYMLKLVVMFNINVIVLLKLL